MKKFKTYWKDYETSHLNRREQKTRSASKIKPEITYVYFTYKKGSLMMDKVSKFSSFDANNMSGKWEIESRWNHTTYNRIFDTEKQFEDFKKKLIKKGKDVTKDFK